MRVHRRSARFTDALILRKKKEGLPWWSKPSFISTTSIQTESNQALAIFLSIAPLAASYLALAVMMRALVLHSTFSPLTM